MSVTAIEVAFGNAREAGESKCAHWHSRRAKQASGRGGDGLSHKERGRIAAARVVRERNVGGSGRRGGVAGLIPDGGKEGGLAMCHVPFLERAGRGVVARTA